MSSKLMSDYKEATEASLDAARCLPFAVYHDKTVFDAETADVFHNDWVFVGAESELSSPGDYLALNIAGEQVAILRGQDGELRALSNICRHRGTPLLDLGAGQISKHIVCPYHAWTFNDQGELKGAPLTGSIKVDKAKHCLPTFAVETWNGLVFVNLSEQPTSFHERIEGIDHYLQMFDVQGFKQSYRTPAEHWNVNWKLAVENGIESYHLFKVHKETLEKTTPSKSAYYVAGSSEWTLTGGQMKDERSSLMKWISGNYPEAYNHYLLVFLPPSFIGVLSYDGFHWIQILPVDSEHCQVIAGGMSEYEVKDFDTPEFQFTKAFLLEDKVICERVQQGMYSRKGEGGKLVELEQILVDFRQFLASRLFGSTPEPFMESEHAQRFLDNS